MGAEGRMERVREEAPRTKARVAGLFYLLTFVAAGVAGMAGRGLIVSGNAAVTATNLLAHESAFRLVFAADLIAIACYIAVTALFYELFKPVNRSVSLLAAFFSLVGCAVQAISGLFVQAPYAVLGGAPYLSVFQAGQTQALALMFLKLEGRTYNLGLVFFGFYCLLIGYLVFRSRFLPRILGVLMMFAGLSWLTFIDPPLSQSLSPYNLVPGLIGEGSLTVWLLAMGVNAPRWMEQSGVVVDRPIVSG